jgi:hypothetical protein
MGIGQIPHLGTIPPNFPFDQALRGPLNLRNMLSISFIQGGQTEQSKTAVVNAQWVWDAQAQINGLFVFGRIFYEDTFGDHWSTKFCYIWEPWHPPGERFVPSDTFNGEDKAEL